MPHTIRLSDEVYASLDELLQKRETFDAAVKRLLAVFKALKEVSDTLGPSHYLKSPTPPGGSSDKATQ